MYVVPDSTVIVDNPTEGSDSTLVGVGVIATLGLILLIIALLDIHTLLVNPKQRKKYAIKKSKNKSGQCNR